ncbi:hypothetical protein [Alkalinema sp. FACHB-956]|uniref:hypothetical protein n=1 Tax=Alkalinema sp. FACHB-956 TaxID=2692768 RepID=UPI00168621AF|nr:hypothetical protein [Alkalinema sp. FACHB-956]MBD2327004.1 hypothetical protein [Alkalinema sp. FACHB-956]
MRSFRLWSLAILMMAAIAPGAVANNAFYTKPEINSSGDYLTNAGPVQGSVSSGSLQAGALWRVVSSRLNCRQDSELTAAISRTFSQGTILQADLGRGGADEVLYNAKDRQGRTWMRVRSRNGQSYQCYVRANKQYIQPVMTR